MKIKNYIIFFRENVRDTEKMLENEIAYFKKIYNFGLKHFIIRVIYFCLFMKNNIKKRKNLFLSKTIRNKKKMWGTNLVSCM